MSDVTGSLSLVTRQDDSYSLDLISGFLDVQLYCLLESVSSDMNPNERILEKMPPVFGPHIVSECVRYFLVFLNFYLNLCTFHTVPNFVSLFIIVNTLLVVSTVERLPQFLISVCLVVLKLEHVGQQTSVCLLFPASCVKKI